MIGLIQTGGTIASAGEPLAPMPAERFRDLWQRHMPAAELIWKAAPQPLDSTDVGPADWVAIARLVLDAVAGGAQGCVVLHGTDTLADTAAALAFLTVDLAGDGDAAGRLDAPIVVTGAMRPLFDGQGVAPGSDAPRNVDSALALAGAGASGCHVVFDGRELPGARVAKVQTKLDAAFAAPNGAGRPTALPPADAARLRAQLDRLAPHLGRRAVLTVTASPNAPAHHAAALSGAVDGLGDRLGAIHLLGFGSGNVPAREALGPVLARVTARGALIAVGTRVPAGPVAFDSYAAGAWLRELGAIGTGDMTASATHAKLHLTLAVAALHGWDPERAGRFFATPLAGEITR